MQMVAVEEIPLQMKKYSEQSMLLIGISVIFLLGLNYLSWQSDAYENAPAAKQIMEVKVQLMNNHLLFEEFVNGYVKVGHEEVHNSLNRTYQMVESSFNGTTDVGHAFGSFLQDELLNSHLVLLHEGMHLLISSMEKGGLQEQHDRLFERAMLAAEAVDERMHSIIAEKLKQQQMLFISLLGAWFAMMVFLIWRGRLKSKNFASVTDNLNKLCHAVEQTGESVLISDCHGLIEYVNPAFTKVTGYDRGEALGKNPSLLSSGLQDKAFYQGMWQRILDGRVWRGEVVDKRKDGSLYRADMSISPIVDSSSKVSHFVAIQRDITELREAQENLIQAKKVEAIGTMCCGLAHDMNNTLSVMIGNLDILNLDEELSEESKGLIAQAEKSALFAADMMKDLLEFSSKDQFSSKFVNLNELVEDTFQMLQRICVSTKLVFDVEEEPHFILGDVKKLHRAVLNLVCNACDAVEDTSSPVVRINLANVSPQRVSNIQQEQGVNVDAWVCLSVSDNGMGIPQHLLEKVFDPFFTTKEIGKGTGLGLSSVYGIMQSHQGFVDVKSKESEGTTVNLYFPCANGE